MPASWMRAKVVSFSSSVFWFVLCCGAIGFGPASMKSSVTPLAVSTGRKGPKGALTFSPSMPATNSAEAVLSRARTIVWFNWIAKVQPPAAVADTDSLPRVLPRCGPAGPDRPGCRDAHTAERPAAAGRGDRRPDRGARGGGPGGLAAGGPRRRSARNSRRPSGRAHRPAEAPRPGGGPRVGRGLPAPRVAALRARAYGPGRVL